MSIREQIEAVLREMVRSGRPLPAYTLQGGDPIARITFSGLWPEDAAYSVVGALRAAGLDARVGEDWQSIMVRGRLSK